MVVFVQLKVCSPEESPLLDQLCKWEGFKGQYLYVHISLCLDLLYTLYNIKKIIQY